MNTTHSSNFDSHLQEDSSQPIHWAELEQASILSSLPKSEPFQWEDSNIDLFEQDGHLTLPSNWVTTHFSKEEEKQGPNPEPNLTGTPTGSKKPLAPSPPHKISYSVNVFSEKMGCSTTDLALGDTQNLDKCP